MTDEQIAAITHEVNRQYCLATGDVSQPVWEAAPEWQKSSAIAGVRAIDQGLVGCPADSHVSWMNEKLRDGWSYGFVKDPVKKEHPCMRPYHELAPWQRVKDSLFFDIALTLTQARRNGVFA